MPSDIAKTFPGIVCDELRDSGVVVTESDYDGPLSETGFCFPMKDEWSNCNVDSTVRIALARRALKFLRAEHDGPWTVRVCDLDGEPGCVALAFDRA